MKVSLNKDEFQVNFNKLIRGLIEGEDVSWFAIDKKNKQVSFLFGDFNVELNEDGTWEIM